MEKIKIDFSDLLKGFKYDFEYYNRFDSDIEKLLSRLDEDDVFEYNASTGTTTGEGVGHKFAEIVIMEMRNSIGKDYASGRISQEAFESIDFLNNYDVSGPYYIGSKRYLVYVTISGSDLERESLINTPPNKTRDVAYENIHNIFSLLNDGYKRGGAEKIKRGVVGTWHGKRIKALPRRQPAHFLEQAKSDFLGNYGSQYNVYEIDIYDIDE